MAIIVVAGKVIPKTGALSLIGVTSGLIAAFLGMGDFGPFNTLLSYTMIGVGSDLSLLLMGRDAEKIWAAIFVGMLGHLGKLLVKWLYGLATGAPIGFIALGLAWSILGYIIFGALGGFLGWLTLRALRKAGFFAYLAEKR